MTRDVLTSSNSAALARLFWMAVGPGILSVILVTIVNRASGWLTLSNLFFFVVLAAMIFARWWEFQGGNAKTGMGDPATPTDLRRYVLFMTFLSLSVWLAANLLRAGAVAG